MDRLDAMTMLVAVADSGSLTAAARMLGVPLTTVSRRIADLEARLGARMLVRTTRRMALTDAGLAYVAAARRILEQVEEAEREASGEFIAPKGHLVLTAPLQFGRLHVLPIVADFLAAHPAIDVHLMLADRHVDLVADQIDLAVRIGRLADSGMVATPVGTLRTVTCASPTLLAGRARPQAPDDLRTWPVVAVSAPMPHPAWRYRDPATGAVRDVAITPRLTVSHPEASADAAVRGVGVARLLHYQVVDAVRRGALELLLESHEPEPVPVQLLHAARGQMPLKMRRFVDFAAPRLRAMLIDVAGAQATA